MQSSIFQIDSHQLSCQHIREYPGATTDDQSTVLQLAIKEYRPRDNLIPSNGDITIIGAHANGFPKEMYEPLWEELYHQLKKSGTRIRGIWIADISHQGASGVLNKNVLGNDPSWFDHSRDLLLMINHFRERIKRPIVGVGHSMGGCQLVQLSLIHPRLLSTLVLLDPMIQPNVVNHGMSPTLLSTFRRDTWPSKAAADAAFEKNKAYKKWNPKVFERWKKYGICEVATDLDSTGKKNGEATTVATLTTTKHQEVITYLRPYFTSMSRNGTELVERRQAPDLILSPSQKFTSEAINEPKILQLYRAEQQIAYTNLPHLRPTVLYMFGGKSEVSQPQAQDAKMALTGTGIGGSGGAAEGKVAKIVLEDAGHLLPMEQVENCAKFAAEWLHSQAEMVKQEDANFLKQWNQQSLEARSTLRPEWIEYMKKERKSLEKL